MWYGIATENVTHPLFALSILPVDSTDMFIGFLSNLIVFPPTILIVLLFKKSKAGTKRKNRVDRGMEKAIENGRFNPPPEGGKQREATEHDAEYVKNIQFYVKKAGLIVHSATY